MATKRFVSKDNLGRVWMRLFGKVLNSKEEIEANTSENMIAGADAVKEVYSSLGGLNFYEDESGNKYVVGADSVPKKLGSLSNKKVIGGSNPGNSYTCTFNLSSIDGYQNFVLWDNLFVVPGKVQFYNPDWVGDIQQTYSYNSNTGILTINTGHGWLRFWQVTVYY